MRAEELARAQSHIFRILGNPLAYRIVLALGRGRLRPIELSQELGASAPAIVNQLRVLKIAGMVRYASTAERRKGRKVFYWLSDPGVLDACRRLAGTMGKLWRAAGHA
ncbi:MAG TPA: metalloregulator ArsR/SmtB family transcription factor [Planctomycetota bacterium]|nr:metalloregulator ArsR/SmtB family transcription factor [Planctomycetota bacterium]